MLLDSAIERARQLATRSPLALALTKQLLLDSYERDFKAQVEEEARLQALAGAAQAEGDAAQVRIAKFAKD
jgi:enoyl-CoA hydratase/carnithine racemase